MIPAEQIEGRTTGYAAYRVVPVAGSWDDRERMGKLEMLVVYAGMRGRRTGRQPFEAIRFHWCAFGVDYGSISVITGNSDAACFNEGFGVIEPSRSLLPCGAGARHSHDA